VSLDPRAGATGGGRGDRGEKPTELPVISELRAFGAYGSHTEMT